MCIYIHDAINSYFYYLMYYIYWKWNTLSRYIDIVNSHAAMLPRFAPNRSLPIPFLSIVPLVCIRFEGFQQTRNNLKQLHELAEKHVYANFR